MTVFHRLGIRPVINAHGTVTILGGSLMPPSVIEAMSEAARSFVNLPDALTRSGQYIAERIGVEAAYITSGAAGGIVLAAAAAIAGTNAERIAHLPDTTGMSNEIVMQHAQRNSWERMATVAGGRIVEADTTGGATALDEAITSQTAAVLHFTHLPAPLSLPDVIAVAHRRNVPVIVDAAAELPPVTNLRLFNDLGADLVIFSGGKMLRGPQATGLILGRADLVAACAANGNPYAAVGRSAKVGKEEIAGLVRAVELFLDHDWDEDMVRWEAAVAEWLAAFAPLETCRARRVFPGEDGILPRSVPRVYLTWDETEVGFTAADAAAQLHADEPAIAVGRLVDGLMLNPITLEAGEATIVAQRVAALFR